LALDRALRPMPNPSRGSVRWAVWGSQSKDGVVLDVQGRVVRRLPKLPVGGEGYLEWDGRDDSGRRVSPGQYFVRVEDSQGYVEKGKVVILR
jgi:flagellar hook assembly protein FlgD